MQFDKDSKEVKDNETRQVTTLSSPSIPINRHHPIKVISLFSGCGGMDLGLTGGFSYLGKKYTKHPFQIIYAVDNDQYCSQIYNANFEHKCDIKDVRNIEIEEIPSFDLLIGGFPCQSFSISAQNPPRLGYKDERGMLFFEMVKILKARRPRFFIAENVKGLADLADVKEIIERDFANTCNSGYVVIPAQVLYAADYGVPQSRSRVIFFGFKKSALRKQALEALTSEMIPVKYNPYPVKTHGIGNMPYVTCNDAFINLDEPDISLDLSQKIYSKAKFMGSHCQGQTEIKLDSIGPTIRAEHHGNIEYRRLSAEHGGKHTDELAKGLIERRLTVRECARIQTFPDDYIITGSQNMWYAQIGNAVPVKLAYVIGNAIMKFL